MYSIAWNQSTLIQRTFPVTFRKQLKEKSVPRNYDVVYTLSGEEIEGQYEPHGGVCTLSLLAIDKTVQTVNSGIRDHIRHGRPDRIISYVITKCRSGEIQALIRYMDGTAVLHGLRSTEYPPISGEGCYVIGCERHGLTREGRSPLSPLFFMRLCRLIYNRRVSIDINFTGICDTPAMRWGLPPLKEPAKVTSCSKVRDQLYAQPDDAANDSRAVNILDMLGIA